MSPPRLSRISQSGRVVQPPHEEEIGTAVGRFHRRALTKQQEPAVKLELAVQKAPRGGRYPNRGFVELGAFSYQEVTTIAFDRIVQVELYSGPNSGRIRISQAEAGSHAIGTSLSGIAGSWGV